MRRPGRSSATPRCSAGPRPQPRASCTLDRSTVANKLRLLKLPAAALAQLRSGALSERQAQALLPLAELLASL